jgi:arabinoxylan arabinofuranohydrolase
LPGGGGFTRSVCVEEFRYNNDGTIPRISPTAKGVKPIGHLNPYTRVEAETIAWQQGIETATSPEAGTYVTAIDPGDYLKVRSVDFRRGGKSLEVNVASIGNGGHIELRLDSLSGPLLGTCTITETGGVESWVTQSTSVKKAKGIHDVYFVFNRGEGDSFHVNWWRFKAK